MLASNSIKEHERKEGTYDLHIDIHLINQCSILYLYAQSNKHNALNLYLVLQSKQAIL